MAEAVAYAAWLQRVPGAGRAAATAAAITAVGLGERSGEALRQLSTGLRRRAFLAQAIVHRPPVLLRSPDMTPIRSASAQPSSRCSLVYGR